MSAFSRAVELRFPGHRGMAEDIEVASVRLGRQMRLSKQSMQRLKTSARLMDIGLCALPYKLINQKASYEWSDAERSTYDRHPEISGAMLDLVPSLKGIAKIVRMHHAPFQADLPVEARVLKVASDYAWLFRQMGEKRAQELILGKVGEEYCPEVVDALAEVLRSSRVQEREHCLA